MQRPTASPRLSCRTASPRTAPGYLQGVVVALSNPKVLLFLGAFFPQFVSPDAAPGPQLAILAILFLVVLTAVDISYTLAVSRARATIDLARLRVLDAASGLLSSWAAWFSPPRADREQPARRATCRQISSSAQPVTFTRLEPS